MNIISVIPEMLKTSGRVLFHGAGTATAATKGILPGSSGSGSNSINIIALVTMGNAADLVLTLKTADNATGTNAVDISRNVAVFVDDVRQSSDAKGYTDTDSTGTKVICFCVPSVIIPEGKYLCLSYGNSNAANILTAIALEETFN